MPQPVDLQTELGRATAAERIQDVADRASLAAVQRQASDVEEDRVGVETQVQQTHESESERVNADGRRRNPFVGRRRRGKKGAEKGKDETKPHAPDADEHHLDVTV